MPPEESSQGVQPGRQGGGDPKEEEKEVSLTPQQRGALITNSGKSPIASLPEDKRKELIAWALDRSLNHDERLRDIAPKLGVSKTALSQALLKYCEDDWKNIQVAKAWVQVENAEDELETAQDMLAVQRAQHRLKSAQWQLERLHRRLFGQEAPSQLGSGTVHIHIGIDREIKDVTPRALLDE
jgi:hypothetical protein